MQTYVLIVSLVLMSVIALIFVSAVRAAGRPATAVPGETARTRLIYAMLGVGAVVSVFSLRPWPHAVDDTTGTATYVNASGAMWYWEIDRDTVPLNRPVIFNVRTTDVTHGFGVADEAGRLLFQTQAMPGYVNQVRHVFTQPGTYHVICMEYCGMAHHAMAGQFTVAAAQ